MVRIPFTTYNAFTTSPEHGNPAAVVLLPEPAESSTSDQGNNDLVPTLFPPDATLQEIATRFSLPMTAFLLPLPPSSKAQYGLRWFNPSREAPLCGHATMAVSHHLFATLINAPKTLTYLTRWHGCISASKQPDPFGSTARDSELVGIEFPELVNLPKIHKTEDRWQELRKVFETAFSLPWVGAGEPLGLYEGGNYILIEFSPHLDLRGLQIDAEKLSLISPKPVYMFQISSKGPEHVHARVIVTVSGFMSEDTATGSAYRAIVPHILSDPETLARLMELHPGLTGKALSIVQQSKGGGQMVVEWLKEAGIVRIMGNAVKTGDGQLEI